MKEVYYYHNHCALCGDFAKAFLIDNGSRDIINLLYLWKCDDIDCDNHIGEELRHVPDWVVGEDDVKDLIRKRKIKNIIADE